MFPNMYNTHQCTSMTKDMSAVLVYKTKESNYKSIVHVHE